MARRQGRAFALSHGQAPVQDAELRSAIVSLLPELRAYARFLTRAPAEADDLVQEAVVRALGAAGQFQPGTSERAWLFTILRNSFFEQARRRRTERAALDHAGTEAVANGSSSAPSQDGQMDLDDLSRNLFRLSPLLREALVLVGAQGLSHEDAAAICSVPVNTMKARVARARRLLARAMETPAEGLRREPRRLAHS